MVQIVFVILVLMKNILFTAMTHFIVHTYSSVGYKHRILKKYYIKTNIYNQ